MGGVVEKEILNFYKDKKVLITGDTGFKGSWLAYWLHDLGADVYGLALPPENEQDHFNLLELEEKISHNNLDIRNAEAVKNLFQQVEPEIVFHMAAQPLVRYSYENPKETFDTNIGGSVNIMEAIRGTASIKSVVYITTDKVYKNKEWIWGYRENDELGGYDPYSASKAAAEIVFQSYLDSFFQHRDSIGLASVRAGNVIGGGDWAKDRIVPDCIKSILDGKKLELRNPQAVRPWQHVLDPLYGYMLLAYKLHQYPDRFSGSYNYGPEKESIRTVEELVKDVYGVWDQKIEFDVSPSELHETKLLYLNCEKVYQTLKWQPIWNFKTAVKNTAQWYFEVLHNKKAAEEITKQQIQEFIGENK